MEQLIIELLEEKKMLLRELEQLVNNEIVTHNMIAGQCDYCQKAKWATALIELQNLAGNLDIPDTGKHHSNKAFLLDTLSKSIGDNFSEQELYKQEKLIDTAMYLAFRYGAENQLIRNDQHKQRRSLASA